MFDGVHRALEELRMENLEHEKTEKSKKRIMLKIERTRDAQRHKEWQKSIAMILMVTMKTVILLRSGPKKKKAKKEQKVEGQCKCGSTTHGPPISSASTTKGD